MEDAERIVLENGLILDIEAMDDDFVFHVRADGGEERVTWGELKRQIIEMFRRHAEKLKAKGFRRVEVGSIQWFWTRNIRKGRFVSLNSMFLARLLKR